MRLRWTYSVNVFGGEENGVDLGDAEGLGKNVGGSDSGRGAGRFDSNYRKGTVSIEVMALIRHYGHTLRIDFASSLISCDSCVSCVLSRFISFLKPLDFRSSGTLGVNAPRSTREVDDERGT